MKPGDTEHIGDGYWTTCPKCRAPRISVDEGDRMYVYDCGTIYCGGSCESQSDGCYAKQVSADYQRDHEDNWRGE